MIRTTLAITLVTAFASATCHGDVIELTSGGRVAGTLAPQTPDDAEQFDITLLTGAEVRIPSSLVAAVVRRPIKFEEYESRARHVGGTEEAHWEMAEWCRTQHLDAQREYHLERVLDYDPEHRQAHYGLGHTRKDDRWLTREEFAEMKRAEGFVKFDGKWVPVEKLDELQANSAATKAQKEWFRKIRVWLNWAGGSHEQRRADGLSNLKNVRDPDAIPALIQFLGKSQHADVRTLFVQLISPMDSPAKVVPLSQLAIYEDVRTIRDQAMTNIPEVGAETAQAIFIKALLDKRNLIVRRAGLALGRMGDDDAVPALIRALVTTHTYRVEVPVQGYGFGSDGSFGSGGGGVPLPPDVVAGLRTGVYDSVEVVPMLGAKGAVKVVPISLSHQNKEVLTSLRGLTKQDFGFDEKAWLRWWNVDRQQTTIAPDLP